MIFMSVALKVNVYGATNFRDSTNQLLSQIETNSMKVAFNATKLIQEQIVRNSKSMIPHKYSTLNRLNNGNVIPLSKSINVVRTKQRQYSILVPKYAIYLDQGSGVRSVQTPGKLMKWINGETMGKQYASKVIHPGNPAYFFISLALAQSPTIIEKAGYEITKQNKRFYK